MVMEIAQPSDARRALGQGGYVMERGEKNSQIHSTTCPSIKALPKGLAARHRSGRGADAVYFYCKRLDEARLFWAFERVEPDILPCEVCQPCGTGLPDIPDCDRELYDWMKLDGQAIANMDKLVYEKFIPAYTEGGRLKEDFVFQVRVTRKLAESDLVRAVEIGDGDKDVDILLDGGPNIAVWHGKYAPDRESDETGGGGRVYRLSEIKKGTIRREIEKLPDGEKGFVVNLVPGDTLYKPPKSLLTVDKCVISSKDCKRATIWRHQDFKHIEDARLICSRLDWEVDGERDGMSSDVLWGAIDHIPVTDHATYDIIDPKTGEVKTAHSKDVEYEPPDDSWCGCG